MKVNDYVRTKYGKIGNIINISKNRVGTTTYLVEWGSCKAYYVSQVKDYKSSPNIIDLIKIGDYVNGLKITLINEPSMANCNKRLLYAEDEEGYLIKMFDEEDIKSIVKKEQFESMEYRL